MRDITSCPEFNRKLRVPDELLGQKVKCPTCGCMFTGRIDDSLSNVSTAGSLHLAGWHRFRPGRIPRRTIQADALSNAPSTS